MNPVRSRLCGISILLQNKHKKWYTGFTENIQKRILEHNSGKTRSTKYGGPWKLIYCEICLNKADAKAREKYLKSGMGKKYLKNRLKFFFAQGF